ncbi:IS256 family transposase [Corynebacterium diphtheriae]|nr:transposase-like protein [Corynebacterium diphtheriae HC02]CAB0710579.1 IS256 family transposase [Corynebacterium diphtheriae]CAB0761828.1 IS256 family transposase [Corynebacterium diphtheriae]CAB0857212.1 IS256 family transposase [Corynebacterium diphtheriae]CAB0860562.1 IS256 family transposase [Corynebacterium diphtheriae]
MVLKDSRRLADAGGMTVCYIEHHLATTIGVNVSPDTMSAVTDAV